MPDDVEHKWFTNRVGASHIAELLFSIEPQCEHCASEWR